MLSKALIKLVQSLDEKKNRTANGLFVVEGNKNVAELLHSKIKVKTLFATNDWLITNESLLNLDTEVEITTKDDIKRLSFLQTPQDVLALAYLPVQQGEELNPNEEFIIALDTIQDPGNMGTIIRIADWYGIKHIVYSTGCADVYSPKVIQATMGSFSRVNCHFMDLSEFLKSNQSTPIYGAVLNGKSIYSTAIKNGILLIGNEGNGINENLLSVVNTPITIPKRGNAESLNASIATAIFCDSFARSIT